MTELTTRGTQTETATATETVAVTATGGDETIELVELHEHREVVHMHHYHYLQPAAATATTTTTTTLTSTETAGAPPPPSQQSPSHAADRPGLVDPSSASVLLVPSSSPRTQKRLTTDEIAERLHSRGTGSKNTLPGCVAIYLFISGQTKMPNTKITISQKCANVFVLNFAHLFRRQLMLLCALLTCRTPN